MTAPRLTIVMTTINVPSLLEGYRENFAKYGHLDRVNAIIIGDRKTPHDAVRELAARVTAQGFAARYVDVPDQERYLDRFPDLKPLIPYNSDNRRNIGYLMAAEEGAEILAAVDDDNFVGQEDWYAAHAIVGSRLTLKTVRSSTGWFNPCDMMETAPARRVYARGFPYAKRWAKDERLETGMTEGRVAINAGLWLGEPDVDSITRLAEPVQTVKVREERLMLAPGTWAPINTQNTAFHRDVLPALYFVPIAAKLGGLVVERYGDIWSGFFLRKALDAVGDRLVFGLPACLHQRNFHVLLRDLELEFWSIQLTDPLWQAIDGWTLRGTTYEDVYLEMADRLEAQDWPKSTMPQDVKAYFGRIAHAMRTWVVAVQRLEATV